METTQSEYKKGNLYTEERAQQHIQIIESFLEGEAYSIETPNTVLLGGGSASGKSTLSKLVLEAFRSENESITRIDADAIKDLIPEYMILKASDPEKAADIVHDESSDISDMLLQKCIEEKRNFLYDGTMKNPQKYETLIKSLKHNGYKVTAIIVDVPIDVALKRAQIRFEAEGRYVPEEIILESHNHVANTFNQIKELVDEYELYDNTGEEPYVFAAKYSDGEEEVVDSTRLEQFQRKSV